MVLLIALPADPEPSKLTPVVELNRGGPHGHRFGEQPPLLEPGRELLTPIAGAFSVQGVIRDVGAGRSQRGGDRDRGHSGRRHSAGGSRRGRGAAPGRSRAAPTDAQPSPKCRQQTSARSAREERPKAGSSKGGGESRDRVGQQRELRLELRQRSGHARHGRDQLLGLVEDARLTICPHRDGSA